MKTITLTSEECVGVQSKLYALGFMLGNLGMYKAEEAGKFVLRGNSFEFDETATVPNAELLNLLDIDKIDITRLKGIMPFDEGMLADLKDTRET